MSIPKGIILALAGLIVLSPVAGAVVPSGDSPQKITFANAETVAERGDITTIPLRVPQGTTTLITVSGASTNYHVQMAINDRDRNGKVVLQINTHLAGQNNDPDIAYAAIGEDRLNYVNRVGNYPSKPLTQGNYNIIASNKHTSVAARLQLVNGGVNDGTLYTASSHTWNKSTINHPAVSSRPAREEEVVKGDVAVAQFNVGGIGALISDDPTTNLVIPADSTPGVKTTHTLAVTATENMTPQVVTIDYNAGDGGEPQSVMSSSPSEVTVLGVDKTGDGIIDRRTELKGSNIEVSEIREGNVSFTFRKAPSLNTSETLYLRFPVKNPPIRGDDKINVEVNNQPVSQGRISYGVAGAGSLGYGVDFRIHSPNATVADPTAGINQKYNNTTNTLIVSLPTEGLAYDQEYAFGLLLLQEYPYGNVSGTRVNLDVARPQARIQQPQNRTIGSSQNQKFRVIATTNLAPQRDVGIEIIAANRSGGVILTNVNRRQKINQNITIPKQISRQEISVRIIHKGQVISEPTPS